MGQTNDLETVLEKQRNIKELVIAYFSLGANLIEIYGREGSLSR